MEKHDFTKGSISRNIMNLALPMTLAQLINVLYNIIDRVYIGRLPHVASHALAGVGITFPIITIIIAFANLIGMGGAPLFSIERGKGCFQKAEQIMGNSFAMLVISGILMTILIMVLKEPILYLFGASPTIFPYANDYITIYLFGSIFVMISLGMNSFINAQGYGRMGMYTVLIGAVLNLLLDPLLIFVFDLGVQGAAIATVLSQMVSAIWVLYFLSGDSGLRLKKEQFSLHWHIVKDILTLGMSGFVMSITNSIVQIVCNATLQQYGGDIYISVMTVLNSIREVITMPVSGVTNGSQPVMSFNYGAGCHGRVKKSIRFMTFLCVIYMVIMWLIIVSVPDFFLRIFNDDVHLLKIGVPAVQLYYFGYFMMAFQFCGQSTFVALNKSKQAIFFSLFRKVIIVVPLTLWLPTIPSLGVMGVFLAEPISNFVGGSICYVTMVISVYRKLPKSDCVKPSLESRDVVQ